MYGGNRKMSNAPPPPPSRFENAAPLEEEEEDDLYEPPPCDLQSRAPCFWTPNDIRRPYGDPLMGVPRPSIPIWEQQNQLQQRAAPKPVRAPPPCKRTGPLPLPDRRMSLPYALPPPMSSTPPQTMDDLYLTLLDSPVKPKMDAAAGNFVQSRKLSESAGLEESAWYGGEMERKKAEMVLRRLNKDGCFLVRRSRGQNQLHPYTLAVLHNDHIYNIPIRAVGTCGFCLGKEGKRHEEVFPSVVLLIEHYRHEQLYLVNRQTSERESTALLYPAQL